MARFVLRKIRNGRVKIGGDWFYPDSQFRQYDGRLDGMVYAFGLYPRHTNALVPNEKIVSLWGREEAYRASYDDFQLLPNGPEVMEDGSLPWLTWRNQCI